MERWRLLLERDPTTPAIRGDLASSGWRNGAGMSGRRHLAAVSLLAAFCAVPSSELAAAEPGVTLGAFLATDLMSNAGTPAPSFVLLARRYFNRHTAMEFSVGYRRVTYDRFGGRSSESHSASVVPVALGLHYVPFPSAAVSPLLGAGIQASFSSDSYTSYSYPNTYTSAKRSGSGFGAYGQVGVQVPLSAATLVEAQARYVQSLSSSVSGWDPNQSYLSIQGGLELRF